MTTTASTTTATSTCSATATAAAAAARSARIQYKFNTRVTLAAIGGACVHELAGTAKAIDIGQLLHDQSWLIRATFAGSVQVTLDMLGLQKT